MCICVCVCKGGPVTLWPWRGGEVNVLFLNVSLRGHWLYSMHTGQCNAVLKNLNVQMCVQKEVTQKIPVVF